MDILTIASRIPTRRIPKGDDGVDRLHHMFTPVILGVFMVVITMQHWVGTPITCWMPTHFTGSHKSYATSHCWVKNTYFLAFDKEIPKAYQHEKRAEIVYYQWLPFILLAQAVLFYCPNVVWRAMNSKAGVDADNILDTSGTLESTVKAENREKRLKLISNQIDRFVSGRGEKKGGNFNPIQKAMSLLCCCCGKRLGNYLTLLYLWVKLLYIGNVVFQLFALSPIFKTAFYRYGYDAVQEHFDEDRDFTNTTVFPKVTMCDFYIRRLGNVQRYTIQCVLPINLFSEKMYMFLWFWMVLLLVISVLNLFMWLLRVVSSGDRNLYVKTHLDPSNCLRTRSRRDALREFTFDYLKQDGVFLLRLIGHNTSHLTSSEVAAALWENWWAKRGEKEESSDDDDDLRMPSPEKPPLPPDEPKLPNGPQTPPSAPPANLYPSNQF